MDHKDQRAHALITIAVSKYLGKILKDAEDDAKTWLLENEMEPNSKLPAVVNGEDVATISREKITKSTAVQVTDPVAFGEWLEANGYEVKWKRVPADYLTAPTFVKSVLEQLEQDSPGELPDGINLVEKTTGGRISARQTEKQRARLENNIASIREIVHQIDAGRLVLEAGETE